MVKQKDGQLMAALIAVLCVVLGLHSTAALCYIDASCYTQRRVAYVLVEVLHWGWD